MAAIGVPNLRATGVPEDVTRSKRWRDAVLKGVPNEGVRFLFDLAFPWSYPGGPMAGRAAAAAPGSAAVVQDMSEHAHGAVSLGASGGGAVINYAGGGFDFTASGAASGGLDRGVAAPASVLADLFTPYGGASQRYLFMLYLKLPAAADWQVTTAGLLTFASDKPYTTDPSLLNIGFGLGAGSEGQIQSRRQTALNVQNQSAVRAEAGDFGTVCQLGIWRNAAGQGLRLRSLTSGLAAKLATQAAGADNALDFSADTFAFGRTAAFSANAGNLMNGFRIYRAMVENLARSGRDPVAVLDADFARVQARAAFS